MHIDRPNKDKPNFFSFNRSEKVSDFIFGFEFKLN